MIEKLRQMLLEPHYPSRYVGRHRAPRLLPMFTLTVRPVNVRTRTF